MNETSNKRAVIVGVFVFLGLVFLLAGVLMIGNLHETFKKKIDVFATFDDVSGLQNGNNIWFSGVKVGTVNKLRFNGKSQVEVTMKLETKVLQYIRKDAKVKISTDGLIGNKILVIYGGTTAFGEVEEGDALAVEKTFTSEDMINMLQKNNENILAITTDFKDVSKNFKDISANISSGKGSLGKLLNDNSLYNNMNATSASLQSASVKAKEITATLATYTAQLNNKGSLANKLVNDTTVFNSMQASMFQLQRIADTASVFVNNLKEAGKNPNSPVGVLLQDEATGEHIKGMIKNLESSSEKLDENLQALQHNFLLRRYFKKKAKAEEKANMQKMPQ